MALKVAVQMDPVEGINIHSDTTFLMMETAQERGHSLWVYTGGYATTFQHPRQFAWSFGAVTRDPRVTMLFWPDCDHTFFARSHRDRLLDTVDRWLGSAFATPEAA